ncbi:MAG: aminotransferase class III-fold pyridoxal phosphate-dependent enzyme, partial [Pseudomonadales bacterium]
MSKATIPEATMPKEIMPTYGRIDISFVKGKGAWLTDDKGKQYLDAVGGLAVAVLGHGHPAVAKTLAEQGKALLHTSNLYRIPGQEQLAAKLAEISGMTNMFFANSGAEANECAIKIARIYGNSLHDDDKGNGRGNGRSKECPSIIVAEGAFHGRTLATLTASGSRKVQAGFEPLVDGFIRVPFNDADAVAKVAASNKQVVAVMVEPIQGEGGVRVPDDEYLKALRRICDDNDWLLIL